MHASNWMRITHVSLGFVALGTIVAALVSWRSSSGDFPVGWNRWLAMDVRTPADDFGDIWPCRSIHPHTGASSAIYGYGEDGTDHRSRRRSMPCKRWDWWRRRAW